MAIAVAVAGPELAENIEETSSNSSAVTLKQGILAVKFDFLRMSNLDYRLVLNPITSS